MVANVAVGTLEGVARYVSVNCGGRLCVGVDGSEAVLVSVSLCGGGCALGRRGLCVL